jgi:hypothetical protein
MVHERNQTRKATDCHFLLPGILGKPKQQGQIQIGDCKGLVVG